MGGVGGGGATCSVNQSISQSIGTLLAPSATCRQTEDSVSPHEKDSARDAQSHAQTHIYLSIYLYLCKYIYTHTHNFLQCK